MEETIFKLKMKKWAEAVAILDDQKDCLDSSEQDAIKTLRNLWRKAKFGPDCTTSVEKMIKLLVANDKKHSSGQKTLLQACKDFRGVAKEMYTKDEQTLKQFAAYMQQTQGGPMLTEEQQRRREEQQRQRQQEAERMERERRERQRRDEESRQQQQREQQQQRQQQRQQQQRQQQQTTGGQQRQQQRQQQQRQQQPTGGSSSQRSWKKYAVAAAVVLLVVGGIAVWLKGGSDKLSAPDYEALLKGTWQEDLQSQKEQLVIDTIAGDSVFGQISFKQRRRTVSREVVGTASIEGALLRLSLENKMPPTDKDLYGNGSYMLMLDTLKKGTLVGKYTNLDSGESVEVRFTQGSNAPAPKQKEVTRKSKKKETAKPSATEEQQRQQAPEEQAEPQQSSQSGQGFSLEKVESSGQGFRLERVDDNNPYLPQQ